MVHDCLDRYREFCCALRVSDPHEVGEVLRCSEALGAAGLNPLHGVAVARWAIGNGFDDWGEGDDLGEVGVHLVLILLVWFV